MITESHRKAAAWHESGHAVVALACGMRLESVSLSETRFIGHAPARGLALTAAAGPVAVMFYGRAGNSTAARLSDADRQFIHAAGVSFGAMAVEAKRLLQLQESALRSFALILSNPRRDGMIDSKEARDEWWSNHDMDALLAWRSGPGKAYCSATAHFEAVRIALNDRRIVMSMRSQRGEAAALREWLADLTGGDRKARAAPA